MEHRPGSRSFDLRWLARGTLCGVLVVAPVALASCSGKRAEPPGRGPAGRTAPARAAPVEAGGNSAGQAAAERAANAANAANTEWAWLQQAKKTLDAERAQLAQNRARQPAVPSTTTSAGERAVAARTEELNRRLVDFINSMPPAEGEKPAGRLLDAVRMKSDEDILLAHEFIRQAGDYRRAIDIFEAALAVDPDNPRLRQELDDARARRYMTAARFAQVKKGMTRDEVRAMLGQPNVRDVREFPERGISAWFYTKDADGRAAAVWFAKDKSGGVTVYMADWNAVDLPREAPAAEPSRSPARSLQPLDFLPRSGDS
jgi:tetratricopeptide (TPR) repeat protein